MPAADLPQTEAPSRSAAEEPALEEVRSVELSQSEVRSAAEDMLACDELPVLGNVVAEANADGPIRHKPAIQVDRRVGTGAEESSHCGAGIREPRDSAGRPHSAILANPIRIDASSVSPFLLPFLPSSFSSATFATNCQTGSLSALHRVGLSASRKRFVTPCPT